MRILVRGPHRAVPQAAQVDLIRGGVGTNGCDNGQHVATSEGSFGITVWGLDTTSSYAYPAGGNVTKINEVVVPARPK